MLIAAGVGAIAVAVIAGALFLVQYFTSDKLALASMGAHEVSREQAPELHAIVERLCIQANLPMPPRRSPRRRCPTRSRSGAPRATPRSAPPPACWSCSTPPSSRRCSAHELTHVQNRDVMVMTLASFFASIASFIVQIGFWFGGALRSGDDNDNGGERIVVVLVAGVVYVDLVRAAAGALALSRVRRRPRLGDHHRAPERAQLGAAQDQRSDGPDPPARPARRLQRAGRLLHLPAQGQGQRGHAVLDPPVARAAADGARRGWSPSCRARAA